MKLLQLIYMAYRYFIRYFRRYIFLFIALCFGFGIITAITGIRAGMEKSVYQSAKSHYAGDLALVGRERALIPLHLDDVAKVRSVLENSGIRYQRIVLRTQYGNNGIVHYNGGAVRHKYILGVDWDNESEYFSSLSYTQGSFDNWNKEDGIIISSPVANELNLNAGDRILLELKTRSDQVNTGNFTVQAIVDDDTIFGYYKCYIDRSALNDLIGFDNNEASTFGIYLKEGARINQEAMKLQKALADSSLDTAGLVSDKDELLKEIGEGWYGVRLFVIPLHVYLSDISELLSAINLIAYFLYFLMLLIIIVSVAVTFRLILHEREKEIGTMRGIGFHERDIVFLLMMETVILFFFSLVTGFVLARFVIWTMGLFTFNAIPSFEIFMKNGRLIPNFTLRTTMINSIIVLAVLIPTVAIPVHNASRKPLSLVLTGGKD